MEWMLDVIAFTEPVLLFLCIVNRLHSMALICTCKYLQNSWNGPALHKKNPTCLVRTGDLKMIGLPITVSRSSN